MGTVALAATSARMVSAGQRQEGKTGRRGERPRGCCMRLGLCMYCAGHLAGREVKWNPLCDVGVPPKRRPFTQELAIGQSASGF